MEYVVTMVAGGAVMAVVTVMAYSLGIDRGATKMLRCLHEDGLIDLDRVKEMHKHD